MSMERMDKQGAFLTDEQMQSMIRQTVQQTLQEAQGANAKGSESAEGEQGKVLDVVGLFFYILERLWCVLLCALIFSAGLGMSASLSTPEYMATAKLYIVNPAGSDISISDLQLGTVLTLDYQEVFKTWEVHEMVREELGLSYSYDTMQAMLTVTNPEDTRLLYITVANPDAQLAADIANAYARAAREFIMTTMKGEQPSDFSIALVPGTAQARSIGQSMVLGFLAGSLLAAGVLTLMYIMDSSPKTPEDISAYGGLSTLAVLPVTKAASGGKKAAQCRAAGRNETEPGVSIGCFPSADAISAEGFNTLVTNLSYCGKNVRKVMITSRFSSEGKSYITMNLMRTLAGMGKKVAVVDADLRASGIQASYGLRFAGGQRKGLSDYLAGYCEAESVVYRTDIANAWLVPAGHSAPNPLQLLDTQRMQQLLDMLAGHFDIVLMDTPPAGMLVDAVALAKYCDGAVLVVGYRTGRLSEVESVVRSIRQTGCSMLGAVLNEVRLKSLSNRHYYYHSRKYSGYYRKKGGRR